MVAKNISRINIYNASSSYLLDLHRGLLRRGEWPLSHYGLS